MAIGDRQRNQQQSRREGDQKPNDPPQHVLSLEDFD
jgi:hypothetical protein